MSVFSKHSLRNSRLRNSDRNQSHANSVTATPPHGQFSRQLTLKSQILMGTCVLGMSVVLAGSVNAQAISIFDPYFTFTDNNKVSLTALGDGFYPLVGSLKGSYTLSGTYQDIYYYNLMQSFLPNPVYVGEPYAPSPQEEYWWEFTNESFSSSPQITCTEINTEALAENDSNGRGWYYGPNGNEAITGSVTSNSSGTLFANITWNQPLVNDPTFAQTHPGYVPPPPPAAPDHVMVLMKNTDAVSISLQNDANGQPMAGLSGNGSVTDSLGGTVSASAPGSGPSSASKVTYRLIRVNLGSNNTGKVSFGGSTNASVVNTDPWQTLLNGIPTGNGSFAEVQTGASISPEFRVDTRGVTVSCRAVDNVTWSDKSTGSRYRSPALTGLIINNVRASDGSMRGDTLRPYPNPITSGALDFSYQANVEGSWAAEYGTLASYQWQSNNPSSGRFTNWSGVPDNACEYLMYNPFTDNVSVNLTDWDGAEATGLYNMHFHDEYEPAIGTEDTPPYKVTTLPDPDVPSWPIYYFHAERDANGMIQQIDGPSPDSSSFPFTVSESHTLSVDGALGLTHDIVNVQLGGGYDQTKDLSSGVSVALPAYLPDHYKTWAVYREDIQRHKGHTDIYGRNGYMETGVWRKDVNIGEEHAVYTPYVSVNTNAFDPSEYWMP